MGLKETIQNAARAGVNALGNIPELVTYAKTTAVTYAPATSATPTETQTSVANLKVLWLAIDTGRIDGQNVLARDREVLMTAQHLGTVTPSEQGTITRANGEVWRVVRVTEDPAGATFRCLVRQ